MNSSNITSAEFLVAAREFAKISNRINDGWKLVENSEPQKSFLIKNTFNQIQNESSATIMRTEYIIFYNISYGVPSFSFNIWNSSGVLMTLETIRKMAFIK